jgi:hypothetical protein
MTRLTKIKKMDSWKWNNLRLIYHMWNSILFEDMLQIKTVAINPRETIKIIFEVDINNVNTEGKRII